MTNTIAMTTATATASAQPAPRLGARTTAIEALRGASLKGRVAVVTGASSGIGIETARALAAAGADVVLAVRNVGAGEEVASQLRGQLPPGAGTLQVQPLDLTDLASVRAFTDAYKKSGRPLHILVNNAGVMATPRSQTKQGFEMQVGTNHVGHFALTTALLPVLERSGTAQAPARVVNVSSTMHTRGDGARLLSSLRDQPAFSERRYQPFEAYGDSKLANVLFSKALARRAPSTIEVFSLHPGVIATNLMRSWGIISSIYRVVAKPFTKSVAQGAATSVFAATAPELSGRSGAYLSDCAVKDPSSAATDAALADEVWRATEEAIAKA